MTVQNSLQYYTIGLINVMSIASLIVEVALFSSKVKILQNHQIILTSYFLFLGLCTSNVTVL